MKLNYVKSLCLLCLFFTLPAQSQINHPADRYAEREDVKAFIDEMVTEYRYERATLDALFHFTQPIPSV